MIRRPRRSTQSRSSAASDVYKRQDYVTGLASRRRFAARLDELFGGDHPQDAIVLLIDLVRFSEINDTLGDRTGDAILHAVGDRLRELAGASALVARVGGDTFAVLDPSIGTSQEADDAAVRIRRALEPPLELPDLSVSVEVSVGTLVLPEDAADPVQCEH